MTRPFTDLELARCAEREAKIRRRVYPNRVMTGRMNQTQAEREIAMMQQIARDYLAKAVLPLGEPA